MVALNNYAHKKAVPLESGTAVIILGFGCILTPCEDDGRGALLCRYPYALDGQHEAYALALPNPLALEEVPCVRA